MRCKALSIFPRAHSCERAHAALRRIIAAFIGGGPRFHPQTRIVSELLAGVHSDPGRCPDAARERGYESRAQAPHPSRPHDVS